MLAQVLPKLRQGQRVSIVVAGQTKLYDSGQVISAGENKRVINIAVDSLQGERVGFRFLPDKGQWRYFLSTSHGEWAPGIGIEPEKEIRYLIEGVN